MKTPANHVAMMQIDCEVMNTRLLYIKEDAIPVHMSSQMRPKSNESMQRNESLGNRTADMDNGFNQSQSGGVNNSNSNDDAFHEFANEHKIYDVDTTNGNRLPRRKGRYAGVKGGTKNAPQPLYRRRSVKSHQINDD